MRRGAWWTMLVVAVVAAACTGSPEGPRGAPTTSPTTPERASTTPPTKAPPSPSSSMPPPTTTTLPPAPDSPRSLRWAWSNPGAGGAFSEAAIVGDVLAVASDLAGVIVSTDGGATWQTRGSFAGLGETHASAVAIDPDDPETILAGTEGGLYRSDDAGGTFGRLEPTGFVDAAAVRGERIVAAVRSAYDRPDAVVWASSDGGETWQQHPLPGNRTVVAIELDPSDPDRALVLTGSGRFAEGPAGIFLLEDGALEAVDADLGEIVDAAFDRHHPATIWATSDDPDPDAPGHLWRLDEGDWSRVADHGGVLWLPPEPGVIRLTDPRHQFPWDDRSGVWQSTDG
ncbi:MAG TPA: hypothetical protein ENK55_12330, partial [Actinobacteria bacterium]|nr:hypothetical protein [Actinomycetota bacterium]